MAAATIALRIGAVGAPVLLGAAAAPSLTATRAVGALGDVGPRPAQCAPHGPVLSVPRIGPAAAAPETFPHLGSVLFGEALAELRPVLLGEALLHPGSETGTVFVGEVSPAVLGRQETGDRGDGQGEQCQSVHVVILRG